MNEIDEKISQPLNAEDQEILNQFGADPGPLELVLATFRGNQWWFSAGVWLFGFIAFVALVLCTLNFFAVSDLKASLTWAMGMLFCGLGLVIVKIGSWQQMQTQVLLREIKRLELRWMASVDKGVWKQGPHSD